MLNFGFFEIMIVVALALVVVGPERLPIVVRYLGRQYGKLLRASQDLRRAFVLEAERVDAEVRQKELQKIRSQKKEEHELKKKHIQDAKDGETIQPLEADIESYNVEHEANNVQDSDIVDSIKDAEDSTEEKMTQKENSSKTPTKTPANTSVKTKTSDSRAMKNHHRNNPFIDKEDLQAEELNEDPLFPRSKQDFS